MARLTVEVCKCCALSEPHISEAVDRIQTEHGEAVEIIPRKCLDICLEAAAVKVGGTVMVVHPCAGLRSEGATGARGLI